MGVYRYFVNDQEVARSKFSLVAEVVALSDATRRPTCEYAALFFSVNIGEDVLV